MPGKVFLKIYWMTALLLSALVSSAFAQDTTQAGNDPATNQDKQAPAENELYLQKKAEFKTTSRKINDLYANLSIGSREERVAQIASIKQLQTQKNQLQLEIFKAALVAAQESQDISRNVYRDVLQYAQSSFEGNRFNIPLNPNITLEACQALRNHAVPEKSLLPLAIQALLAKHDFETVKSRVNAAINGGLDVSQETINRIKLAEQSWLREEKLRSEERDLPTIRIQTTLGDINIVLFEDAAPQGVKNFISLVDEGFFDDLKFFTANRGQHLRSGCPKNDGSGAADHFVENESGLESARHHFKGSLSMMALADGSKCSSQFLLTQRPLPHLNGNFAVIGRITDGMEVLDQLVGAVVDAKRDLESKPSIETIEVTYRRPDTNYVPEKIDRK